MEGNLRSCFGRSFLCFSLLLLLLFPPALLADKVVPSDRVTSHVNVREGPSGDTAIVGQLQPGEEADLIVSVPGWHKVRLSNGIEGFVHKAWTNLVPDGPAEPQFQVHFLDVGTGDAAIIDVGDREIVIDGGDSTKVVHDYAARTGIIDGPIELVVVTHADSDHWKGLNRLLSFDGHATQPHAVLEFWEPGYNRDCSPLSTYDTFIANIQNLPGIRFRRPLETTHPPAVATGQPAPLTLPSIPGATITLLHTDTTPEATNNDCAYRINNASIVLLIEIAGIRFLFTGDANGKERDELSPGTPGHIEAKLLALEATHPGTLRADVLKVPHHGSETASTQNFIDAVNPRFVVISASTKHHLPKPTTVHRYENGQRVILRTDAHRENDLDHIMCFKDADGKAACNYKDVLEQ